jgi:hypothetical protein
MGDLAPALPDTAEPRPGSAPSQSEGNQTIGTKITVDH